ncbi:MAG: protein kinase [Sandaracinaceae bacterium]
MSHALGVEGDDIAVGQTVLGRYRLTRLLGSGGMGRVFEAVQEGLDRRVAVKMLLPDAGDTGQLEARFRREAKALAKLHHPHIAQIVDFGADQGRAILVMEYVDGEDLRAVLRREGPFSTDRALSLISPLLGALSTVHKHGIVHRDIKPENVLVVWDEDFPIPKLIDFGVAKLDARAKLTGTHRAVGTAAYMAPEQIQSSRDVGPAADQYAAGLMLFEMLSGRRPHEAESIAELAAQRLTTSPQELSDVASDVAPEIARAVMRALAFDPSARFTDVAAFRAALLGHATTSRPRSETLAAATLPPMETGEGLAPPRIEAGPTAAPHITAPPSPRRRAHAGFAAMGLLLVGLAGWGALRVSQEDTPNEDSAPAERSAALEDSAALDGAPTVIVPEVTAVTEVAPPAAASDAGGGVAPRPRPTHPSRPAAASRAPTPPPPPLPEPEPVPRPTPAASAHAEVVSTASYNRWAADAHLSAARAPLARCVVNQGLPTGLDARYRVWVSPSGRVRQVVPADPAQPSLDACVERTLSTLPWSAAIGSEGGSIDVRVATR